MPHDIRFMHVFLMVCLVVVIAAMVLFWFASRRPPNE